MDVGLTIYCDLIEHFLQSAFRPCYLGCESNRSSLEYSLRGEVTPYLHSCVNVGVLSCVLIFHFIIWLLEVSLKYHQSSLTICPSTWCHIKGSPCFYFVTWCIITGAKGWFIENSLRNWLSTLVIDGWSNPFFSWKWESTQKSALD